MLSGDQYKTAHCTNTVVKLKYAHWAVFIGVMLAGAEAKLWGPNVANPVEHHQRQE